MTTMSNKETGVEEVEFNINYYVKVRLTDHGKALLRKQYEELIARFPKISYEYIEPKIDKDGYTRFQLWDLMSRLGEYTSIVLPPAFETNIIICNPAKIG